MRKGQNGFDPKDLGNGMIAQVPPMTGKRADRRSDYTMCDCVVGRISRTDFSETYNIRLFDKQGKSRCIDTVSNLKMARHLAWSALEQINRCMVKGANADRVLARHMWARFCAEDFPKSSDKWSAYATFMAYHIRGRSIPVPLQVLLCEWFGFDRWESFMDAYLSGALVPRLNESSEDVPKTETPEPKPEVPAVTEPEVPSNLGTLADFIPPAIEADLAAGRTDGRPRHSCYQTFRDRIDLGGTRNYLIVGPAGSGKTTLAQNLAEDLDLPFGFISVTAGVTESHLLGRILPPKYELVPSPFVRIYSEGGVFLLDEVDAADPNVLLTINSALANGMLVTPDGQAWKRHEDCYIIAAANTWGKGASRGYSGRNQLDRSTRDRFTLKSFEVGYCSTMEASIARSFLDEAPSRVALLATTLALRHACEDKRIEETISARFIVEASQFVKQGKSLKWCVEELMLPWSATDRSKVEDIVHGVERLTKACEGMADRLAEMERSSK